MTDRREEFDAVDAEPLEAAEAFSLLGHPLRLDIVRGLWTAGRGNPVPFSELYDRVDATDTGKFNYHRKELIPYFVRGSDDGYRLTEAGERVARAVNAGTYTGSPDLSGFDVPGDCYDCGVSDLRGEYVGERFRIDCRACGNRVLNVGVPPSVARGRDPAAFVDAVQRWAGYQVEQATDGICPSCGGPVDPGLSEPGRDTLDVELQAVFDCEVCDRRVVTNFGSLALRHEAVQRFHRERNHPLDDRPYWTVAQSMTSDHSAVVSTDPFRFRVEFHAAGDSCQVTFADDLTVVDVTVG